jgi:hypothetical protein
VGDLGDQDTGRLERFSQPFGGVTPELLLLTATPPTSVAPVVCVATAGTASVVAAVALAGVAPPFPKSESPGNPT